MFANPGNSLLLPCLMVAASAVAQDRLEDVVLPKVDPWMAGVKDAFGFRHAPMREDVAWFVVRAREDRVADKPGHYLVAWSDRGGGEVHNVDLGNNLGNEDWFVGPVWNHQADRVAVAIVTSDGTSTGTKVVVIDTKTATAKTWTQDVYPASLSWAADGRTLAVADAKCVHVMIGPADEVFRLEIPSEPGWGAAAAISPDGTGALAVSARGVFILSRGEEPVRLGDVPRDATIFTAPQWSVDGTKAVAAAGGGVVLIDVGKRTVNSVGEQQFAGRAHAAVWAPGEKHVLAFVEQVRDGSAVEVLLGAGHARQRYSMLPVVVSGGGDRVLPLTSLNTETTDPRFTKWFYRPQSSEALSRWHR